MLDGIPITGLTTPTLLGIGILLILTGRLVPRWFYQAKVAEADNWKQAYNDEREARITVEAQSAELLEVAKTTHDIISAMFLTIQHDRLGLGESDVPKT